MKSIKVLTHGKSEQKEKEKETENQLILGMLQGGTFYFSSKDLKMYFVHTLRSVFYFASKDKILLIYYVF